MHSSIVNLISIEKEIQLKINKINAARHKPKIIAVSKNFTMNKIAPLIEYGHTNFGENKVQEALAKWSEIKNTNDKIKLHLLGKLQSNKVKYVIPLFDYIHTLDSLKLAKKISQEQIKRKKNLKIFIQINLGREDQKNGILIEQVDSFYKQCIDDLGLNIVGLMCLPPNDSNSIKYFLEISKLAKKLNLKEFSMGMSGDYLDAIEANSTYLRIGSKIFGDRN